MSFKQVNFNEIGGFLISTFTCTFTFTYVFTFISLRLREACWKLSS